jgi:transcriptional regulator with XRE-family HTH domain
MKKTESLLSRSKLDSRHIQAAKRLKNERIEEGFSVAELAKESGVSAPSLKHYEHGLAPISLDAGLKICRRLDLNQRWLATGKEPKRPFIPVEELTPTIQPDKRISFLDAYRELELSVARWHRAHPPTRIIHEHIASGPGEDIRRMSRARLESFLSEWISMLRKAENDHMKLAVLGVLELALQELRRRLKK